ncbi:type VII secretion target [Prescottella subtropica]|uniref:type VII secretion target n=1 Tax=Prescottella subtropica TaxID=2545757 RepID=UPI0010F52268|nr:type VII secretion target [Prescottella subtropica]
MSELSVTTSGITGFGTTAAGLAGRVGTADSGISADGAGLLGPVFGLIGGDFVAAFDRARAAHSAELGRLAGTWTAMSDAATTTAAAYDATDAHTASGLSTGVAL